MADAPKLLGTDTLRTAYPKVNMAIDNANEAFRNSEDALDKATQALANSENTQAQLDQIVIEGDSSVEAAQARVDADGNVFTTLKERLDTKETQFANEIVILNGQMAEKKNEITWVSVKNFGAIGDGITDDTQAIKDAIAYAISSNIYKVVFPSGIYRVSETIYLPVGIELYGEGRKKNSVSIEYIGEGWAIATDGGFGDHRRNSINGITINLKSEVAAGAILVGSLTDDTIIPVNHTFSHVEILDLKAGQVGIWLKNASGISMKHVYANRGTGGTGLLVSANGNNTGVMNFECCSFGGINQNDIGVELRHGSGGLDGFTFSGCYFGGKKPILISGTSGVKNVTLNSAHIEATPDTVEYYGIDINSVHGLTINSVTFYGNSNPNYVAMVFRGQCSGVVVNGVDANEFLNGTLYKNVFTTSPKNSILSYSHGTGINRTIIPTSGNFDEVLMIKTDGIQTKTVESENVKTNYIFSLATGRKIDFGTSSPANDTPPQARSRGDFRFNTAPSELGTAGSKYIVLGWMNIGSGTPGNIVECRVFTGN